MAAPSAAFDGGFFEALARRLERRHRTPPPGRAAAMSDAPASGAGKPENGVSGTASDQKQSPEEKKYEIVPDRGEGEPHKGKHGKGKKRRESVHVTSESTLMDLDDSHIPDGATPFEKQMHQRIKAMDRDGDGKITIQERPPSRTRLHLARSCPLPE